MAKKGNRIQVIMECTEHKESGMPGTSRYITTKNKKQCLKIEALLHFISLPDYTSTVQPNSSFRLPVWIPKIV